LKVLVVFNPWAGPLAARPVAEAAAHWWRARGWQVEVAGTEAPGGAFRLARDAAAAGLDTVIVAGGDGTLSEAADGLAGSQTALGLLPMGTGNLWAREVGLKPIADWSGRNIDAYAQAIAGSTLRSIDVGTVGRRHFLLWLGVGLDGHIVERVEPRGRFAKLLGEMYYVMAAVAAAPGWTGARMEVSVDGVAVEGHMLLVLVGNGRRYGGRLFQVSPQARLDDGLLEMWAFRGRSYADALSLAWLLLRGEHAGHPDVFNRSGRQIVISGPADAPSQVDGDRLGQRLPLNISVRPRALRVLVPPGAPDDLFVNGPML
jgi:YegS/Rv2252/BmrU family lipid kinase